VVSLPAPLFFQTEEIIMKPIHIIRDALYYIFNFNHFSNRKIKAEMDDVCSHQFIGGLKNKATTLKLSWPRITALNDDALKMRIYKKVFKKETVKAEPDHESVYQNSLLPKKRQKTRALLYFDYHNRYGKNALKQSQFYARIRRQLRWRKAAMKQFYRPGEILFIDYAGTRLHYQANGEYHYLYVFVACVGFSKKLFAFATPDMTTKSWLSGLRSAFEYFGGVTEVVQCDNAKAMISKAGQIAKVNDNALAFSRHFSFCFDTSRVGTPTDNANAEAAVKFITMNILVLMNTDLTFFSLSEINAYLLREIEVLNEREMQTLGVSRNATFEVEEKAALAPLESIPFELFLKRKTVQVPSTYMLNHEGNYYSVPHHLRGEKVEIIIREDSLTVHHKGIKVIRHDLTDESVRNKYVPSHMTPAHLAEASKNKEVYLVWAHEFGVPVVEFIEILYAKTSNPHSRQVGKVCSALQKLSEKYEEEEFSEACQYAISNGYDTYSELLMILRTKVFEESLEPNLIHHHNLRGKAHYEGFSHE
jgi:hypothetical protein